jgi:hypothetical protein
VESNQPAAKNVRNQASPRWFPVTIALAAAVVKDDDSVMPCDQGSAEELRM